MKKCILTIIASIFLSGCFPIVERIYQPTAQGGISLETTCHYDSGPGRWDKIELTQDEITMHARAEDEHKQLIVHIDIFVPEGKAVRFTQNEATVLSTEPSRPVSIQTISNYDKSVRKLEQQEATSLMIGQNEPTGNRRFQRAGVGKKQFSTALKLPSESMAKPFTLHIPPLQLGSGQISFQPIHFEPVVNARVGSLCP